MFKRDVRWEDIAARRALRTVWADWTQPQLDAYTARLAGIDRRWDDLQRRSGARWTHAARLTWARRLRGR